MKIILTAINAKYIHSNPAVYSLKAYADKYGEDIEIAEYTINHYEDDILTDLYKKRPDIIAFSCYIWNINYVKNIIADIHKLLPEVPIWLGGPEVSYDAKKLLLEFPMVTGVMVGEGEETFLELVKYYTQIARPDVQIENTLLKNKTSKMEAEAYTALEKIQGITYRNYRNQIKINVRRPALDMNKIPFIYEHEDISLFKNKIVYYETSRGCPFSCSYCLSSIDKSARLRDTGLVKKELQFFLDKKIPQVKFVDRTFNCSHTHAMEIWNYIKDHDNGITNFHFEIAGGLLNDKELQLLNSIRPGLVQLEIGIQSTNSETILEIDRVMDFGHLGRVFRMISQGKNIHQHLDLIAGLPYEDYESFQNSFNDVFELKPDQLQLGFLKILKGSKMFVNAEEYGIVYKQTPPYEVLYTNWITYDEILRLKAVEEMVEVYYNSSQFCKTLGFLLQIYETPFDMFLKLAEYYDSQGLRRVSHTRMNRYEILLEFIKTEAGLYQEFFKELLVYDLYLRDNLKSRPSWASDLTPYKKEFFDFYQQEEKRHRYLKGYEKFTGKQQGKMTHLEVFHYNMNISEKLADVAECDCWALFDYKNRNPLNSDARVCFI